MVESIQEPEGGSKPLTQEDIAAYQKQHREGLSLFKQSLEGYSQSTNVHQKDQFKQAMDETLQAMNKAARGALSQDKLDKEKQLKQDYLEYMNHPSKEKLDQLNEDIQALE